jgi:hypothetical protein
MKKTFTLLTALALGIASQAQTGTWRPVSTGNIAPPRMAFTGTQESGRHRMAEMNGVVYTVQHAQIQGNATFTTASSLVVIKNPGTAPMLDTIPGVFTARILPIGSPALYVTKVFAFNNRVYVSGDFGAIDGDQTKRHIAAWTGTAWQAVKNPTISNDSANPVAEFCIHGGQLYCQLNNDKAIRKYDEATNTWTTIIPNNAAGGLASYNNKLYYLENTTGSAYKAWDGTTATTAIASVRDSNSRFGNIYDAEVANGKLYLFGLFDSLGNVFSRGMAQFDGTTVTSLGGGLQGPRGNFPFVQHVVSSTLGGGSVYMQASGKSSINPTFSFGGTTCRSVAAWTGSTFTCAGTHSYSDTTPYATNLEYVAGRLFARTLGGTPAGSAKFIYLDAASTNPNAVAQVAEDAVPALAPNPATGIVQLSGLQAWQGATVRLLDLSGRVVHNATVATSILSLSDLQPGFYLVQMQQGSERWNERLIVQ